VPGAPIDVTIRECRRERRVRVTAFLRRGVRVHGRASERVRELDVAARECDESGLLRCAQVIDREP